MTIRIEDDEAEQLVGLLAKRRGVSANEAVKLAVRNELSSDGEATSLWERLKPLHDRIAARGSTGIQADKTFLDGLNDE